MTRLFPHFIAVNCLPIMQQHQNCFYENCINIDLSLKDSKQFCKMGNSFTVLYASFKLIFIHNDLIYISVNDN